MKRYRIKEAFNLPSGRLMHIGSYYFTEDEAEIESLRKFVEAGSCEELQHEAPKEEAPTPADPAKDLAALPGMTKTLIGKLAALNVKTPEELKSRLEEEAVVEALGEKLEKIKAALTPAN